MPEDTSSRRRGPIPAWLSLERDSLMALLSTDGRRPETIRVAPDTCPTEIAAVPIMGAARLMIERAVANGGLKLTTRGALSRADTEALFEATTWPDYSKEAVRAAYKVLNEADVPPINYTRVLAQMAGLLRRRKGLLLATKLGKEFLNPDQHPALFSLLFETAFWRMNLGYLDCNPVEYWPQTHIGVVLWCLSVVAHTWSEPGTLVRLCTVPDEALAGLRPVYPEFMMAARVLRPLMWFGLMEGVLPPERTGPGYARLYRKSALYDRVLAFEVAIRGQRGRLQ